MNILGNSAYFGIVLSIAAYSAGLSLKKKFNSAVLNPLLVAAVIIIVFLVVFGVSYEEYNNSTKYLSYLLTPATVSLAIPLYRQLESLKKNPLTILLGLFSGVIASLASVFVLCVIFDMAPEIYYTLLPKSVTTAIGIEVARELGGKPTVAATVIVITGVLGNVTASGVLKFFKIKHPIAVGLAIGCSSHAVGTARAMEIGEVEGAMSSLAIAVSGIITVLLAPLFAQIPL